MTATGTSKSYDSLFSSFGLKGNPFHASPDPQFLFSGPAYQTAIAELMFGIESRRGLLVLTGEAGTGKTTLVRYFLQWLSTRNFSSAYVFHSHLNPAELFEFMLRDFDVAVDSTKKTDLLATLLQWLKARQAAGDTPVLIIDEAQALSVHTLSELRLLLNLENSHGKFLQIILAGQPELVEKLNRPELSALRQRIMVHCRLPLLTLTDTAEYINARLRGAGAADPQVFPPETVQTLYSYARGIPRVTNLLCERAMIGAYADRQTVVSSAHVREVAAEYDLEGAAIPRGTTHLPLPPNEANPLPSRKINQIPQSTVIAESPLPVAAQSAINPPATAHASIPEPAVRHATASVPLPQSPQPGNKYTEKSIVEFRLASDEKEGTPKIVNGFDWRKRRPENPFTGYWSDVWRTFLRDARQLYLSVVPREKPGARNLGLSSSKVHHSFLAQLVKWLRSPVNLSRRNVSRSAVPPARAGKT